MPGISRWPPSHPTATSSGPGDHAAGPDRAARRRPRRAAAGRDQHHRRYRRAAQRPGDRDRGPGLRRGARRGARAPRHQALTRPAGPRRSAGRSRASPPGSSAAAWCRWLPTRACRSWSLIRLTARGGGRSTGSPLCASTTRRRPGTTRQRWCSGDAGSATGPGAARTGTVPPLGRGTASPGAAPATAGSQARTQETRHPTRPPAATRHQDRLASPDHGGQPGGPAPYGTAGTAGPSPARSIRNGCCGEDQ